MENETHDFSHHRRVDHRNRGIRVKSGSLTAGETANLEKKESAINQEIRTDRSLNGGKLTSQERKTVNGQQNAMSHRIYRDKHNAATQHYGNNEVDARRSNQQQRIANGIASGKLNAGETARLEKGESAINRETRTDRALNGGKLTHAQSGWGRRFRLPTPAGTYRPIDSRSARIDGSPESRIFCWARSTS